MSDLDQQQQKPRSDTSEVWKGIGLAFLVLPVQSVATGVLGGFAYMAGIRVSEGLISTLVWVIWFFVIYRTARDRGHRGIVRGLALGLGLMLLLAAVAYGLLYKVNW